LTPRKFAPDPLAKEAFTVVLWIETSPPLLFVVGDWAEEVLSVCC
jgi:hypothetical protein